MAILQSPGVVTTEKDFSTIVPNVSISNGAVAGYFEKGPCLQPILITSESDLFSVFGKPTEQNSGIWFSASQFLQYSNKLWVTRAIPVGAANATSSGTISSPIANRQGYEQASSGVFSGAGQWIAKDIGSVGKSFKVVMFDSANFASGNTIGNITAGSASITNIPSTTGLNVGDSVKLIGLGLTVTIPYNAKIQTIDSSTSVTLTVACVGVGSATGAQIYLGPVDAYGNTYQSNFASVPATSSYVAGKALTNEQKHDEVHVLIIDTTGAITGVPNTVIEKFSNLSKAADATDSAGRSIYYVNYLNDTSSLIWWSTHPTTYEDSPPGGAKDWGSLASDVSATSTRFKDLPITANSSQLTGTSLDGVTSPSTSGEVAGAIGAIESAYELLKNIDLYDISLVITGNYAPLITQWVVQNLCEVRKDCVAFVSALKYTSGIYGTPIFDSSTVVNDLVTFRTTTLNIESSYAILDTGWKYINDQYNKKYRWIPLNGDIAGLCARTDTTNDPWWSPGGFNRGQVKNSIKLAVNLNEAQRDIVYPKGINPVVSFPGQGTVLFGDRTMQSKPSAFDRINVRRLFIVLEKAIARAAKYQLFEFNDTFTRASFRNMVEPFLRDVQGRRGLTDFIVICDETNNTAEVINNNRFVGDIYIKPNYSINFIYLNFVATKQGVSFSQVIGG